MLLLASVFQVYQPSKIQSLEKHCNKNLTVLIYLLLVAKLTKVLIMAHLSFCHYSSDPSGAFTIKTMENDSNNY
jgi:hypothetical protein